MPAGLRQIRQHNSDKHRFCMGLLCNEAVLVYLNWLRHPYPHHKGRRRARLHQSHPRNKVEAGYATHIDTTGGTGIHHFPPALFRSPLPASVPPLFGLPLLAPAPIPIPTLPLCPPSRTCACSIFSLVIATLHNVRRSEVVASLELVMQLDRITQSCHNLILADIINEHESHLLVLAPPFFFPSLPLCPSFW